MRVALVCAALACAPTLEAQTVLDSLRTEVVRMRAFVRSAETQATKVLGLVDRVIASQPTEVALGGVLSYPGAVYTVLSPLTGYALSWTMGVTDSLRLCGYVYSATDTIGKSWAGCPGSVPVVPFTWTEILPGASPTGIIGMDVR